MEPRELVARVEHNAALPNGEDERFSGYGVMALPFRAGHIMGLRRFPASSIGPGYASVWHRDPEGHWTFYTDISPRLSCNRYFGAGVEHVHEVPIDIEWRGPRSLSVRVGAGEVDWQVNLQATPVSRLMSTVCHHLPESLWHQGPVLGAMGGVGGRMLRAGKVTLHGRTCNGQQFEANPQLIWTIPTSKAIVDGRDLGEVGPIPEQARLGDFWLPQRGLFMIGQVFMEQFDPATHENTLCQDERTAAA